MTATLTPRRHTARRELDHRSSNGIDVTLSWRPTRNDLVLTVREDTGGSFELEVAAHEALDAFDHPYAYAARAAR
jgi:hypothetical protein